MPFERAHAPALAELNASFADLQFLELIGVGRTGAMYKAVQNKLDRVVAVRILPKRFSRDQQYMERFCNEARVLGRLNHGNLMTVYDFGVVDEMLFLITEHIEGPSLDQVLSRGVLPYSQAMEYAKDLASALDHAHGKGVAHKAVKASNILLDRKKRVKLIDFSIGKSFASLAPTHELNEEVHYLSPEAISGKSVLDVRSDVYSFGVLLLKCLTGMFPLDYARSGAPLQEYLGELYPLIFHCIRTAPEQRFSSMSEVLKGLEVVARKSRALQAGYVGLAG